MDSAKELISVVVILDGSWQWRVGGINDYLIQVC